MPTITIFFLGLLSDEVDGLKVADNRNVYFLNAVDSLVSLGSYSVILSIIIHTLVRT